MASESFFQSVQLDRVALRVPHLDRALGFYQGTLGLEARQSGPGAATLSAGATGGVLLELEAAPSAPSRQHDAAGLFHVALLFPTRASLGHALTHLIKAGVRLGSADHGVSEALYLADPEGNGLELYVDRPVAAWPQADENGQVTMFGGLAPPQRARLLRGGRIDHRFGSPPRWRTAGRSDGLTD